MSLLVTNSICKAYIGHKALDNVSIEVPEGSVYGLLGPNGAGKTTLIRIINHITAPDEGEVIFKGHRLVADDVLDIGYLPEERGLYKKMKVGEQCIFFASLKGMNKKDATARLKEWFERLEITNWWDKKVDELSKGMAQKVQFIITVLHRPSLLIFDEPFSGFDPINANLLKREILALRDQGATVIFSTHNMASVEELCDRITLINNSRNVLTGEVNELRQRFGGNRMSLKFKGNEDALRSSISLFADGISVENVDNQDLRSMVLNLKSEDMRRDLISAANSAVDLVSFEPLLPTMDEIFISAVGATSQNTNQE